MADRIEELLRACTVRVSGGPMAGAGFFVAPRRVVTCVHVTGDHAPLSVTWERDGRPTLVIERCRRIAMLTNRGRPIPALDRDYPDIAILALDEFEDNHPCVRVDLDWPSIEDSFQVFGYPEEGGAVLLTPARLTYRGTHGTHPTAYLDLASDTIKPGMSGAAVLNLRSGAVCGVVVASKHPAHPDGALAIPWSAITPDLDTVLAANRTFHLQDRRWNETVSRKRLSYRVPRVTAYFTGRDDLLTQLASALSKGRTGVITQAISGLGGVGKTQLAAAYVAAHQAEFDIVAWVRAEDGGIADLANLAVALALPVTDRTPSQRAEDVLMFLANTDRRWLLVLDNVHGPEALTSLPVSGRGQVLVTSRHRGGYEDFGAELAVDVFDTETACQYLLARSDRIDEDAGDVEAVAIALGCLPLALAHAGAYCAAGAGIAFSEYLALLKALPSHQLFDASQEVFYQQTVTATWNISIVAAEHEAALARQILEMTAYLAPEGISRSFFSVLEKDAAIGRKEVADALAALHRYSLFTMAHNQISIHRLLQKVIRDRLTGSDQSSAIAHALTAVQRAMPEAVDLPATWPQWQELTPHVATLASIDAAAMLNAAQLMKILNGTCEFLLSSGAPLTVLNLAARGVSIATDNLGSKHLDTLNARANLASSHWLLGHLAEAVTLEEQGAADRETVLGPDHPDTLNAWGNLAISYHSAGRIDKAIAIQERVVASLERLLGPEHPGTLTALVNLAFSYRSAERVSEAIAIEERVATERERLLGPEHPSTLNAQANMAVSYRLAGRVDESIVILERVVAERERLLGPEHPNTLAGWSNLAASYRVAGSVGEAIAIEERVATERERLLGPEHPSTLNAQANMAVSYRLAGRVDESIVILERVVAERERLLGPEHPDTLATRTELTKAKMEHDEKSPKN